MRRLPKPYMFWTLYVCVFLCVSVHVYVFDDRKTINNPSTPRSFLYTGSLLSLSKLFVCVCACVHVCMYSLSQISPEVQSLLNDSTYRKNSAVWKDSAVWKVNICLFLSLPSLHLSSSFYRTISFIPNSLSSPLFLSLNYIPSSLVYWVVCHPSHFSLYLPFSLHLPLFLPLGFALSDLSEAPDSCLFPAGSHQRHWPYGRNSDCALLVSHCFVFLFIFSLFPKCMACIVLYGCSLWFLLFCCLLNLCGRQEPLGG